MFGLFGKIHQWNIDPDQQRLAQLFIKYGEGSVCAAELTKFVLYQDWSAKETRQRILHALSIVKIAATPYVYQRAKEMGHTLYDVACRLVLEDGSAVSLPLSA
jgi:hypothetical protein